MFSRHHLDINFLSYCHEYPNPLKRGISSFIKIFSPVIYNNNLKRNIKI